MKLLALGLLSLGMGLFAFCMLGIREESRRSGPSFRVRPQGIHASEPNNDYWLYPGEQGLEFYYKIKGENSIKGLRSLDDLHADVIVLGPTGEAADTPSPYRIYENVQFRLLKPNDSWSDSLSLKGTDVSEASINVDVKVESMPKDEDLWGRDAKLVTSGRVSFPHKINNDKYLDRNILFREEITFRFASRAEKENYEAAYKEYRQEQKKADDYNARAKANYATARLLSFTASVILIGSALWVFFRSMRQRRA